MSMSIDLVCERLKRYVGIYQPKMFIVRSTASANSGSSLLSLEVQLFFQVIYFLQITNLTIQD